MNRTLPIFAAALAFTAPPVWAQSTARPAAPASAPQAATDAASRSDTARTVEIKRSSTWGFSEEVRKYLSDSYEDMYKHPEEAAEDMMIASNMLDILAAAAPEGASRQRLMGAAQEVSRVRQRVQNNQALDPERDLAPPFARATLAIAMAQAEDAQRNLADADESGFGYSLESAADNLRQTLIYSHSEGEVGDSVARAIFNANRLGEQVTAMLHPTTQQGAQFTVTIPEEASDTENPRVLEAGDENGAMDKQNVAQMIDDAAPKVMQELQAALEEVDGRMKQQDQRRSSR